MRRASIHSQQSYFARRRRRAGFTLVETMVVLVLLAIVATLAAPRLTGWRSRAMQASAEAVSAVVSSAASRDQLGTRGLALDFDGDRLCVMLQENTDRGPVWRTDAMSPGCQLGDVRITSVTLDGSPLEPSAWRWEFPQGERRPVLVIVLGEGKDSQRIELGSLANTAVVLPASASPLPEESIDLDATGRGDSAW